MWTSHVLRPSMGEINFGGCSCCKCSCICCLHFCPFPDHPHHWSWACLSLHGGIAVSLFQMWGKSIFVAQLHWVLLHLLFAFVFFAVPRICAIDLKLTSIFNCQMTVYKHLEHMASNWLKIWRPGVQVLLTIVNWSTKLKSLYCSCSLSSDGCMFEWKLWFVPRIRILHYIW